MNSEYIVDESSDSGEHSNDDFYQQINELDIDGSNEVVSEQPEMSRNVREGDHDGLER